MRISFNKPLVVFLAGLVLSTPAAIPDVQAQTLFDLLFKKKHDRARNSRMDRPIVRPRIVRKKPRVKTAQVFNYRPYALQKIKFSSLATLPSAFGIYGPQADESDMNAVYFLEAARQLKGFAPKARKDIGKAVLAHYKAHPGFLWVDGYLPNEAAKALLEVFSTAPEYGLESEDYAVDVPEFGALDEVTDIVLERVAKFEIAMSLRALRYGMDAANGRINPNRLSGYHDFPGNKISAKKVMASLYSAFSTPVETAPAPVANDIKSETTDMTIVTGSTISDAVSSAPVVAISADAGELNTETQADQASIVLQMDASAPAEYLLSLHPSHKAFGLFRQELATLRQTVDDAIVISQKTFLRPGKSHEELPNIIRAIQKRGSAELLETFADVINAYDGSELYSEDLVDLVKAFQKENKLKPDGIIGKRSIAKLSDVPIAGKIDRLILSMERLRWHPRYFGKRYVFINQPAYRASYISDGKVRLSMKVVVGKRSNQTNFFYDKIERVVYNPYWGVPRSILVNEMLPKLRRNPGYLDQRGYELTTPSGQRISSASVDWYNVGENFGYNVRQTPGPKNALGELKILFPNKHNIYMHDTPAKSLFNRSTRALSHGCVRLKSPRRMAAAVLGTSVSSIKAKLGAGHGTQNLKVKVPVYVAYFTAWPSDDGKVRYYYDMYGRDKNLLKAIAKTRASRQMTKS